MFWARAIPRSMIYDQPDAGWRASSLRRVRGGIVAYGTERVTYAAGHRGLVVLEFLLCGW